jgi:hypothetical protein
MLKRSSDVAVAKIEFAPDLCPVLDFYINKSFYASVKRNNVNNKKSFRCFSPYFGEAEFESFWLTVGWLEQIGFSRDFAEEALTNLYYSYFCAQGVYNVYVFKTEDKYIIRADHPDMRREEATIEQAVAKAIGYSLFGKWVNFTNEKLPEISGAFVDSFKYKNYFHIK